MSPLATVKQYSRGELVGPGPADAGHAQLVGRVLQHQRVVRDHGPEHHHAALLDQPAVAVDHLAVVLAGQPSGVGDDQLDGAAGEQPLVEGVLDGQDGGVDPVGQELVEVHVDEDPDLHRLEGVALGLAPVGGGIDGDPLHRPVMRRPAAVVPRRTPLAALALEVALGAVGDRAHRPVGLGDAQVDRLGVHPLGVGAFVIGHGHPPKLSSRFRTIVHFTIDHPGGTTMDAADLILVSVDDHLVEPPDMFDSHMPAAVPRSGPQGGAQRPG